MRLVCGKGRDNIEEVFEAAGKGTMALMRRNGMLNDNVSFLDIGCGCGRIARLLVNEPNVESYSGFDRHKGMIDWCTENITPRAKNFQFSFVPVISAYDNKDGVVGTMSATKLRFPYDDNVFDSVLLASVFTHMSLDDCKHYLAEIKRVV